MTGLQYLKLSALTMLIIFLVPALIQNDQYILAALVVAAGAVVMAKQLKSL